MRISLSLINRTKALRKLSKLESACQPPTIDGTPADQDTSEEMCEHLRGILSDPPELRTILDKPLRNTDALILTQMTEQEGEDNMDSSNLAIQSCYQAHRLTTRRIIRHARRLRHLKYGQSLLRLFTKKPKAALKSILKTSKHNPLYNEDPTPTDLSVIADHLHGGITADPRTVLDVVEDLQRKNLSPDPSVDPHAPFPWEHDVPPSPQPETTLVVGRLTQEVFDEALRRNPHYKAAGLDEIPGVILNNMPTAFLDATLSLFQLMAVTGITPPDWLRTHTVLLYKKSDPLSLDNYRPIALAPILYKLWASCLTILASNYVESHKILSPEHEGFRWRRSMARAILHLLLGIEDAHPHNKDILICYLDFKGAYPSAKHIQLTRILQYLGMPSDFCAIVSNLYRDATTAFLTPYGPTVDIPVLRGTLQGDPLSPLLFDLMMEPLIRWLNVKKKGYKFESTGLTLASKWYADDATLLSDSEPKMVAQLQIVESYSIWSGIRLNVPKCCITGFIQQLQSISRKSDRDAALAGRLAYFKVSGRRIKTVSQDEPLPGGYLGTALTASLNPQAQLSWIKAILNEICQAVTRAPLPPKIRHHLLLYGAHSKIMHTHCLLALSPSAIAQLDSILESACRRIWSLPASFPRASLHAPQQEWGLNLPSLWEDYCASAVRTWTTIMNDKGALGLTARASLTAPATKFAQWPLELAFTLTKKGNPICTSLSAKCMAAVIMGDLHPIGAPPFGRATPSRAPSSRPYPYPRTRTGAPSPHNHSQGSTLSSVNSSPSSPTG